MNDISVILKTGDSAKKISVLEDLATADSPDMIENVIASLDDDDVRVRGEAFSSLVLNENRISEHLIRSLNSASTNIRGFASLVLANRNEPDAIPELVRLAGDGHPMVRSCAVGALGHMRAGGRDARDVLLGALLDGNLEVRKSAAHAVVTIGMDVPSEIVKRVSDKWADDVQSDPDLEMLLGRLNNEG